VSGSGHEWTKHERRHGWSVCSRCGMVRNYDRETTTCSGALPKIRQRSEIASRDDAIDETRAALATVAACAQRLVNAKRACDAEAERHPSSRSSAPMVRYIEAMQALEEALVVLDEVRK
jgi:hypothetical protein